MNRALTIALVLSLSACASDGDTDEAPRISQWLIGPVIDGKNYSRGLPDAAERHPEGWAIDFGPDQSPHYVTRDAPTLTGRTLIRMRFRTEGAPIVGVGCPTGTATVFLQARGEKYSGSDGKRWWASFATVQLGEPKEYEIVAPLDGNWTSANTMQAHSAPEAFAAALKDAQHVGFTFGNCEGLGHGITATGPAKIVVTHYGVE
jgi:hypothetical protein